MRKCSRCDDKATHKFTVKFLDGTGMSAKLCQFHGQDMLKVHLNISPYVDKVILKKDWSEILYEKIRKINRSVSGSNTCNSP